MTGTSSIDQIISLSSGVIHWLFTWSWQALLLLGVSWIWLKFDRSRSATTRYRIWLIAVLAVVALPLLSFLSRSLHLPVVQTPFPIGDAGEVAVPLTIPLAGRSTFSWPSIIWPLLFVLWLAGVIVSLLRLGNSLRKLHLIRSGAQAVSLTDLDCTDSELFESNPGAVSFALSESIQSPALAGLFRPVILLPADIASWTSREERASIMRHEFAHIERRDHFMNLVEPALKAFFFFHPMVSYACRQLCLEREFACDDRVLGLGTKPKTYAEAILKAAERSCLTEMVYQMASFNSKKMLERRIKMILNANRRRQPLRQWPFLLLPLALIGISAWLIIPAASSQPRMQASNSQTVNAGYISDPSISSALSQSPAVDRSTLKIETVKRGALVRQVRGLGILVPADNGRLIATIQIPVPQARDIRLDNPAAIDTRNGIVYGKVFRITLDDPKKVATVDLSLEGELPQGVVANLNVDGTIEIERLDDVLSVGRPANGRAGSISSLFKVDEGGATATRVQVKFGKSSHNGIEIIEGLKDGDHVIISNMSGYAGVDTIRLK